MPQMILFASHNANKIQELNQLLAPHFAVKGLNDLGFKAEIPENENTLQGNATAKASFLFNAIGGTILADDSGLLVDALGGKPGVYSARYAGLAKNNAANIDKVLQEMTGVRNRKAHFSTVLCLIFKGNFYHFEGVLNGSIAEKPKGENGFGYDSIFIPDGFEQTLAEITSIQKNAISHRALAVQQLLNFLEGLVL